MEAGVSPVKLKLMKKIKEFIKDLKKLRLEEIAAIIFCVCMVSLFVICIICFFEAIFFESERKYLIRDVSGGIYYVDDYVKESDGTIKIDTTGIRIF